ncbi:MAG: hypothetical protein KC587_12980, partial [Nitrospira sp.]|nr:hypothetical protein [Nitrospira sp.]
MTNIQPGEVTNERLSRSQGRLPVAGVLLGGLLLTLNPSSAFAQDSAGVPERMAYVPFGPAIMGIDKDPAEATATRESATLYQRRMS